MSLNVNRTTHSVSFNTGISTAEYNEAPAGQTLGTTQQPILPGSTTVSEALANVFPTDATVSGQILGELAARGSSTLFRTTDGYRRAAERAISDLSGQKGPAARAAVAELKRLLDDGDLLASYRASLLES